MTDVSRVDRSVFGIAILLCSITVVSNPVWATDCKKVLELHGFKASAQASCGFGQAPNEALDQARICSRKQPPSVNMSEIRTGDTVFRLTEMRMGHGAACRDVLAHFMGVLIAQ